jgi:Predicted dinucleotide-binding enzymes
MNLFNKALSLISLCAVLFSFSVAANAEETQMNKPVKIGVIGAGWLGGTVGKLLVKSGYEVFFSTRHPEELKTIVSELGSKAHIGTPKDAAAFADVVLIATPYSAIPQISTDYSNELKGKIILDATNPPAYGMDSLAREAETNGVAVTTAKHFPQSTLVRVFSAVDASAVEASYDRVSDKLGVPVASNDVQALQLAATLVKATGCEPVIVGDLNAARSFQRGGPGFRANTNASNLRRLLNVTE